VDKLSRMLKKEREVQNKVGILLNSRVRNQLKIAEAVKDIKKLRRPCPGFNSIKEIRKWRKI